MSQDLAAPPTTPPDPYPRISDDPNVVERHTDFCIPGDGIIFQIENTLYRLPPSLLNESDFFRGMFDVASAHVVDQLEGATDEHPIAPAGVTKFQMDSLLTVLLARLIAGELALTLDQWVAVLHLSNKWMFRMAKTYAVERIEKLYLDPITRITLARQCDVTQWLKPAFVDLCIRSKRLTGEDIDKLGYSSCLAILSIQKKILLDPPALGQGPGFCDRCRRTCYCPKRRDSYGSCIRCSWCGRACVCETSNPNIGPDGEPVDEALAKFRRERLGTMVSEMRDLQC